MSPRIEAIVRAVRAGRPLYDLCCDHGLIGRYAFELKGSTPVHFVDQSPAVVQSLRERLKNSAQQIGRDFFIWESPAEKLTPPAEACDWVLAGIGIPTTIRILDALFPRGLGQHRLIIAPQQKTPPLRAYLHARGFRLVSEDVLLERGRYREILVVEAEGHEIALAAESYGQRDEPLARAYLQYLREDQETIARLRRDRRRTCAPLPL